MNEYISRGIHTNRLHFHFDLIQTNMFSFTHSKSLIRFSSLFYLFNKNSALGLCLSWQILRWVYYMRGYFFDVESTREQIPIMSIEMIDPKWSFTMKNRFQFRHFPFGNWKRFERFFFFFFLTKFLWRKMLSLSYHKNIYDALKLRISMHEMAE